MGPTEAEFLQLRDNRLHLRHGYGGPSRHRTDGGARRVQEHLSGRSRYQRPAYGRHGPTHHWAHQRPVPVPSRPQSPFHLLGSHVCRHRPNRYPVGAQLRCSIRSLDIHPGQCEHRLWARSGVDPRLRSAGPHRHGLVHEDLVRRHRSGGDDRHRRSSDRKDWVINRLGMAHARDTGFSADGRHLRHDGSGIPPRVKHPAERSAARYRIVIPFGVKPPIRPIFDLPAGHDHGHIVFPDLRVVLP